MIPTSDEVRIEIATSCNYNCIICARDKFTRAKEIMPTGKFRYYLEKIMSVKGKYGTLTFSGFGEPLLDKGFLEKAEIAKAEGFQLLLLTNASLLTVPIFKRINELGFLSIRISFYGITPESYGKMHSHSGGVDFEKLKATLTEICRMDRKTKIIFTYNVVEGVNDGDLKGWIDYWEPIADLLEVWKPHNWVTGRGYRGVKTEKLNTCGRPFSGPLQVQADGTVNMCCFDFDGKLVIGDLNKQTLSEIFASGEYNRIKERHTSGDFSGSGLICENCDQRNVDKSDVMVYNSKFDINERVRMVSTNYQKLL